MSCNRFGYRELLTLSCLLILMSLGALGMSWGGASADGTVPTAPPASPTSTSTPPTPKSTNTSPPSQPTAINTATETQPAATDTLVIVTPSDASTSAATDSPIIEPTKPPESSAIAGGTGLEAQTSVEPTKEVSIIPDPESNTGNVSWFWLVGIVIAALIILAWSLWRGRRVA